MGARQAILPPPVPAEMAFTDLAVAVVALLSTGTLLALVAVVALAGLFFNGVFNMRVAALKNNVVVGLLEAFDLEDAQLSMPDCTVRLATELDVVAPVARPRQITPKEFRDLFSPAELAAIIASADIDVRVLLYKISTTGNSVDLDSPEVKAGLQHLQSKSLLTDTRRVAILA